MSAPLVYIVILNYNGREHLAHFLPSVQALHYPNCRIVVGDNASTDDSLAFLNAHYPDIILLKNDKNEGFAAGYNSLLHQLKQNFPPPAYYFLLNSDATPTANALQLIIARMEAEQDIAVVQPKILDYNAQEHFEYAGASGGFMDLLFYPFCRGRILTHREKDTGQYDEERDIFWASGAAFCIRSALFHQVGGFNPYFFAHHEEIDLCWRLQNKGWRIRVVPQAIIYHIGGGTMPYNSPQKIYYNHRNNLIMIANNLPPIAALWRILFRIIVEGMGFGIYNLLKGKPHITRAVFKAHLHFWHWYRGQRKKQAHIYTSHADTKQLKGWYKGLFIVDMYLKNRHKFSQLCNKKIT